MRKCNHNGIYERYVRKWMGNKNVLAKGMYEHYINGWETRMQQPKVCMSVMQ